MGNPWPVEYGSRVSTQFLVLGAGFGGLEVAARLSDAFGAGANVTLIDKNDGFVFGFSKFELMFGRATLPEVKHLYRDLIRPGVTFRQETITAIDPVARRVTTDRATYDAGVLVVALGAEYEPGATPGFLEGGHEFYSVDGALALRDVLAAFAGGSLVIGVLGHPFKCPPAPCEAAMLLDDWLVTKGRRANTTITVISPLDTPIPPSPDGSRAILDHFAAHGITYVGDQTISHVNPVAKTVHTADGAAFPYDLFLGIPIHRVPAVVKASGMTVNGWVPVDETNLATRFPGVYAIGDVASAPVPKAGGFAESAARAVATHLIDQVQGGSLFTPFDGTGVCYIEFGGNLVGRVDVDTMTGPQPTGPFAPPSSALMAEKAEFGAIRRRRWFGG